MQTTQPTAAETYAARRADIARLIDVLQVELDSHATDANASPRDWSFAGDLGKIRSSLIETVASLRGVDAELVEDFLNT